MSDDAILVPLVAHLAAELAPKLAAELSGLVPQQAEESKAWHLLSLREAAERLGRSERWVRERVKRGDLAHVRLDGGALAFDVDDLRDFARARRVGTAR